MRKQIMTAALVVAAAAGFAGVMAVAPSAPPALAATCATGEKAMPDFDGSGGNRPDIAIGIPGEDVDHYRDAGALEIRYAGDTHAPQPLSAPRRQDYDRSDAWQQITGGPEAGDGYGSWIDALQPRG
jgi:hypothetical protein